MGRYRLTPAAVRDRSSIWDYTEQLWDIRQSEIHVRETMGVIERIAENPGRGRTCGDIRQGYRRYAIGSHLVFYFSRHDGIEMVRILHQRMDPTRHL